MKKLLVLVISVALCAIFTDVASSYAFTLDEPHFSATSGGSCNICHANHLDLGITGSTQFNNTCMTCHRPGDPAGRNRAFTPGDAANPFGTYTSSKQYSQNYQTSHRWDGSDTVPAAGAQPPIQGQMTSKALRNRTGGQLACVRCHNQHSNTNGNFLRMPNDQDQMCMDCHRSRNVQSHTAGSHPVNVSLATAKGNFAMQNANPSNPTSDLSVQLNRSGGVVLCSSCHGVHHTDSRSSTVDGSANFANLSSGDGNLLRTDRRGAAVAAGEPDKINLCTSCHAGKKNHNLRGQDVQCNDCHGAHVEYDPNDPTGSKGTNVFLIRRAVPKGGTGSGAIFFRYTGSSTKEYKNEVGTGVCQGCHAVPAPGGIYPQAHSSNDPRICNGCHNHGSSSGSFSVSGGCNMCHGYPPLTAAQLSARGAGEFTDAKVEDYNGGGGHHTTHIASAVTASEGFTPCLPCHPASSHNQGGGVVSRSNINVNDPADANLRFDDNRTKRYNASSGVCSNISCHFQPSAAW